MSIESELELRSIRAPVISLNPAESALILNIDVKLSFLGKGGFLIILESLISPMIISIIVKLPVTQSYFCYKIFAYAYGVFFSQKN